MELTKNKVTPKDVAQALGISTQAVRVGLQRGVFPFGWAVKLGGSRYTYAISPKLFAEYLGHPADAPATREQITRTTPDELLNLLLTKDSGGQIKYGKYWCKNSDGYSGAIFAREKSQVRKFKHLNEVMDWLKTEEGATKGGTQNDHQRI